MWPFWKDICSEQDMYVALLLNSPHAALAPNLKLQLKGLEKKILNAITFLKQERKKLENDLPNKLAHCDELTSNPRWKHCFDKSEVFRKGAFDKFNVRLSLLTKNQRIGVRT